MSENSKKKYFSVFIVTFIIFISSIHETNFYETGDHERVEVELDSSYSSKQSIDNLNFRTDDILSGVLNEVGDKEGGRVCHPDCPSGWEEDEYDLWEVENSDVGGTLEVRISDIGADDGTDATVEICFGNLGSIWCSEVLEGNGGDVYVIDKIVLNSYIRISPNPSFFDDDVDYSIEIIDEFEDNNLLETMTIPWERSFSYNGYVCSEQCHDDNEEWSEFGNDFGDYYEISLLTNEEMLITINTETIPNRGYIHFWLIYEKGSIWHVEKVTFGDEGELEVYLQTDVPLTYTLIIASGISNDWDGMTYEIKGDLLWKNNLRSWMNNDYDGDGWDDITERYVCETEHLDYDSVPEDNDRDFICDIIDLDDDNDGWSDLDENTCLTNSMSDQSIPSDFDNDMVCDFVDPDDDDDGVLDRDDAFPLDNSEWTDSDGDGTGNNADTDDDNDGRPDWSDAFPLDDSEWTDSDGDGTGNNADTDDDNDGWSDLDENKCLTSPTSDQSIPSDFDNDMICDLVDTDSDNDGFTDEEDIFPFNFNEWADYNQDGIGDNEDPPPFITKRTLLILSSILFLTIIIYFSKQKKDKRKKLEEAMVEYPKGDLGVIRQSLITFENERKYFITEYEKSLKQDAKSMIIKLGEKLDKKAESDSKKMKEIYLENIEHHKKFEKSETLDKKYEYRIEWEKTIRKAERAVYDVDQKEYHHIVLDGWLRNWDWEISSTSTVLDDRNKLEKQIKKDLQITRKSKKEQEKIEKREKEKELKAKKERERKAKAERERKAAEERERMAERERIRKAEVERERKVTEERERKGAEERERKAAEER
ncbi:hypothetical protein N8809_03520 [Euryarchaeota archaeon]|nr:hypothetical protein [Euryarchaeota archaeon]